MFVEEEEQEGKDESNGDNNEVQHLSLLPPAPSPASATLCMFITFGPTKKSLEPRCVSPGPPLGNRTQNARVGAVPAAHQGIWRPSRGGTSNFSLALHPPLLRRRGWFFPAWHDMYLTIFATPRLHPPRWESNPKRQGGSCPSSPSGDLAPIQEGDVLLFFSHPFPSPPPPRMVLSGMYLTIFATPSPPASITVPHGRGNACKY